MATLSHAELETLWTQHGGTQASADIAAAVAQAESGGDTSRINNTAYPNRPDYHPVAAGNQTEYSVGLWQINMLAHPQYTEASLLTAAGNATAAVAVARGGASFGAWSTYDNLAYRSFLTLGVKTYPVTLVGGPCDGRTVQLPGDVLSAGMTACGGKVYRYAPDTSNPWIFQLASDQEKGKPVGQAFTPQDVFTAFHTLMYTLSHRVPAGVTTMRADLSRLRKAVR